MVEGLRSKYSKDPRVTCQVVDCCKRLPLADSSVFIVLDKGTLDALHAEQMKVRPPSVSPVLSTRIRYRDCNLRGSLTNCRQKELYLY